MNAARSSRLASLSFLLASFILYAGQSRAELLQNAVASKFSPDNLSDKVDEDVYAIENETGSGKNADYPARSMTLNLTRTLSENVVPFAQQSNIAAEPAGAKPFDHDSYPMPGLRLKISDRLDSLDKALQSGKSVATVAVGTSSAFLKQVQSWADLWHRSLTAQLLTDYSVDPALLPGNSTGVWLGTFNTNYALHRIIGADELKAGGALSIVKSSNLIQSVNRTDPSFFFNWLHQNNTGEFGISTEYSQSATRQALGSSSRFYVDSTINTGTLSANWSEALNERSTLSSGGAFTSVKYSGGGNYSDYATRSLTLQFSRTLSEIIAPFLSGAYNDMVPSGKGPTNRRINAMVGMKLQISEKLDSSVQVGKSREIGASGETSQFVISMQYKGQRSSLSLNADRSTTASGLGGFVTANHAGGAWVYDLSERSKAGVNLAWTKSFTLTDDAYGTMETWMQYDLDPDWGMNTHFSRKIHQGGGIGSASSNVLGVSFIYSHSDF